MTEPAPLTPDPSPSTGRGEAGVPLAPDGVGSTGRGEPPVSVTPDRSSSKGRGEYGDHPWPVEGESGTGCRSQAEKRPRVGIDAHALGRRLGGNETYIRNVIRALAAVDPDGDYTLFLSPPLPEGPITGAE